MNILIFFPYNQISIEQQSVMKLLIESGHKVTLLTLLPLGDLHKQVTKYGVEAISTKIGDNIKLKDILANSKCLKQVCRDKKIDLILAHQQICALIVIFAGKVINNKSYYFRHNTDEDYNKSYFKAKIFNYFINIFIKKYIAPSQAVYNFLIHKESVSSSKIRRINYGYDFDLYAKPVHANSKKIRNNYSAQLLIISIARLASSKRHRLMFETMKILKKDGLDVKMICLGGGSLQSELEQCIKDLGLTDTVFLLGVKHNIFDYLAASNLLLHFSDSEASNSVVKESALVAKPVIVCNKVGDFEEYIESGENSFLVSKDNPIPETIKIVKEYYSNKEKLSNMGKLFHNKVTTHFTIDKVAPLYEDLIKNHNL